MATAEWDPILDGWNWQAPHRRKLDRRMAETLCELICEGLTLTLAAAHVGIYPRTFHAWMDEGAKDIDAGRHTMLATLRRATQCARAAGSRQMLEVVRVHARGDWRAAQWYLERCHRGQFGKDGDPGFAPPPRPIPARVLDAEGNVRILDREPSREDHKRAAELTKRGIAVWRDLEGNIVEIDDSLPFPDEEALPNGDA